MRKIIPLLLLFLLTSCVTNYYTVVASEDIQLYNDNALKEPTAIIPANSEMFISGKKAKKRIKYKSYSGWAYEPVYKTKTSTISSSSSYSSARSSSYSSPSSSAGKTVHVKGYTRKDGTYVKPHTRSAPGRRKS